MPITTKKFIFVLFTLILLLVGFTLFQKLKPQPPEILSTQPINQSREVPIDTQIEFKFDRPIKINDFKIEINPEFLYHFSIETDKLILKPENPLNFATVYTLKLTHLPTKKEISQLTFQTLKPQGSYEAVEEIQKEQEEDYPLAPFSPPDNASFYFFYTGPKQIRVFLKADPTSSQKEFLDWAASLGIDLSDHQIEWK